MELDIHKYLGTWYELAHYPTWFIRNDSYNTTATYTLNSDGTVNVCNKTMLVGNVISSNGTAKILAPNMLRVSFTSMVDETTGDKFDVPPFDQLIPPNVPNYVVDKIFCNCHGDYIFAVVTDPTYSSLYVLSRFCHPSKEAYAEVMKYVTSKFDSNLLVQTPHY